MKIRILVAVFLVFSTFSKGNDTPLNSNLAPITASTAITVINNLIEPIPVIAEPTKLLQALLAYKEHTSSVTKYKETSDKSIVKSYCWYQAAGWGVNLAGSILCSYTGSYATASLLYFGLQYSPLAGLVDFETIRYIVQSGGEMLQLFSDAVAFYGTLGSRIHEIEDSFRKKNGSHSMIEN